MKVWLIRLSMGVTLDAGVAGPLLRICSVYPAGRSHAIAQQAGTRSAAPPPAKRARYAEGGSPTISRKVRLKVPRLLKPTSRQTSRDRAVGLAQQLHRALDPAALKVAVRRLAERRAELAAEVRGRDVGDARERRNVERLRKRTVHRVASPQHPAVAILDRRGTSAQAYDSEKPTPGRGR